MSAASLPSGLWDLTISRMCARPQVPLGRLGFAHSARSSATQATLSKPKIPSSAPFSAPRAVAGDFRGTLGRSRRTLKHPGPLTPRSHRPSTGPLAEMERRVQELKEAANAEVLASEDLFFSENDLLSMYEDLLALPPEEPGRTLEPVAEKLGQPYEDIILVRDIEQKLVALNAVGAVRETPLVAKLRKESPLPALDVPVMDDTVQLHWRVIRLAAARLDRINQLSSMSEGSPIPIAFFTLAEYEALTRHCIYEKDLDAAESVLHLMKRSGLAIPEDSLTSILTKYTEAADVHRAEHLLAEYLTAIPTEPQRHLHVKCHLKATPTAHIPESALTVLHAYETQGQPAPMKTYTSVIASLLRTHLSVGRAQAWDLFAHMRYVAHPKPDVVLYTAMIRACASPVSRARKSDPERALDLWTEMTIEQRLTPTVASYNAVILACAKSGRKHYVNEAFRLAKEMFDAHRDAYGHSAYEPDRGTLCALLEGAKRVGDLARARWILADLVRADPGEREDEGVNDQIMVHVFHTYAAYTPPFTRNLAKIVPAGSQEIDPPPNRDLEPSKQIPNGPQSSAASPRFTQVPPQTHNEVIEEVQVLFQRILEDTGKAPRESGTDDLFSGKEKFKNVKLSAKLLDAYLAVHYQHSSLEASAALFWKVFNDVGVVPSAASYLAAIEKCAVSNQGRESSVGLQFAEKLWAEWKTLEDSKRDSARPLDARMIERAHIAFMRILTLNGELHRALNHVRAFVAQYPPSHLYNRSHKPNFRSTRTILVGARPLVRLTSPNEVPDDGVPPLLMFQDLEILHHRLVAASMVREIGYIKYISKAYEWALRGRRDSAMKARPAPTTHSIAAI
ncbi:hypothetical protein C8J57DRAFT_294530 [Mycena rebaudengoi]|nr:hypothetical protein C8J57DRAFT_294530 [Mycena rebaudengoi]